MISKIILASKSGVRKKILEDNGINCEVVPANIDEDIIKNSLIIPATRKLFIKSISNKFNRKKNGGIIIEGTIEEKKEKDRPDEL